jgi:fumarate reductase subunit C
MSLEIPGYLVGVPCVGEFLDDERAELVILLNLLALIARILATDIGFLLRSSRYVPSITVTVAP